MEINDGTDWWLESFWKIKSIRQNYGLELFIMFLVDPMYEGNNKSSAVYNIEVFSSIPLERPTGEKLVSMFLMKGKVNEKLEVFVKQINNYRNNYFK